MARKQAGSIGRGHNSHSGQPDATFLDVFGLIRSLITLAILGSLVYCGAKVELGERTFFGHVSQIWSSEETQDLVEGVKEKGEPVLDTIERGVKAGYREMTRDDAGPDSSGE